MRQGLDRDETPKLIRRDEVEITAQRRRPRPSKTRNMQDIDQSAGLHQLSFSRSRCLATTLSTFGKVSELPLTLFLAHRSSSKLDIWDGLLLYTPHIICRGSRWVRIEAWIFETRHAGMYIGSMMDADMECTFDSFSDLTAVRYQSALVRDALGDSTWQDPRRRHLRTDLCHQPNLAPPPSCNFNSSSSPR